MPENCWIILSYNTIYQKSGFFNFFFLFGQIGDGNL